MPLIDKYPYTNFHELNLDWLLKRIKELETKVAQLEARVKELEERGN